MQAEVQKPRLFSSDNNIENDQQLKNTIQNYKVQLSIDEAAYIMQLLPPNYSLQLQSKIQKRTSTNLNTKVSRTITQKKKSADSKLLNQVEPELNRLPSIRTKKSANIKYNDQISEISYAKYTPVYPTPEVTRRNTYQGLDQSLKPCVKILNLLKNSRTSWPFREPVDPIAMGIPHYTEIVKQPMDLSKIEQNLKSGQYATPTQFHADLSKIIRNSYAFNKGNIEFTKITQEFQQYYFKIIADPNIDQKSVNTYNDTTRIQKQSAQTNYISSQIKRKKPERQYTGGQVSISLQQKKQLSINIRKLPREHMKGIVDIVKQQGQNKIKDEFDLEDLKPETIRELQNYVRSKLFQPAQKIEKGKTNDVKDENEESEFEIESEEDS